jgi:hypothetical protein
MGPCRTDVLALCSWHLKLFNCLSILVVFSKGSLVSLGGLPGFFVSSPSNFKEDGNLVCILVERVSCFFIGLQINISFVDLFNAGVGKGLDLVGSFIGKPLQGVTGRIWAELKVFSARGFDNKVKFEKARLAKLLPKAQQKDSSIQAVILYAARLEKGRNGWDKPLAEVWMYAGGCWKDISPAGTGPLARGKLKDTAKPTQAEVWAKVKFTRVNPTDPPVGLLVHFLNAMGKPSGNSGKSATALQNMLAKHGHNDEIWQEDVGNCGDWPYVAEKSTFQKLYYLV